jgi:hypothetical protein
MNLRQLAMERLRRCDLAVARRGMRDQQHLVQVIQKVAGGDGTFDSRCIAILSIRHPGDCDTCTRELQV